MVDSTNNATSKDIERATELAEELARARALEPQGLQAWHDKAALIKRLENEIAIAMLSHFCKVQRAHSARIEEVEITECSPGPEKEKTAQDWTIEIMARAPRRESFGHAFAPKYKGRCALSGAELLGWHQVRMVKLLDWDKARACLNGAFDVFAGASIADGSDPTPQAWAVPFGDVTVEELIAALRAGCEVQVYCNPHEGSSKYTPWSCAKDGKFIKSSRIRRQHSVGKFSEKQAARYLKQRGAFAVRVLAPNRFGNFTHKLTVKDIEG